MTFINNPDEPESKSNNYQKKPFIFSTIPLLMRVEYWNYSVKRINTTQWDPIDSDVIQQKNLCANNVNFNKHVDSTMKYV